MIADENYSSSPEGVFDLDDQDGNRSANVKKEKEQLSEGYLTKMLISLRGCHVRFMASHLRVCVVLLIFQR